MKRKLIIALAAAMTITLGSVGVVSADDANFAPFIPVNETGIRDGFIWVVDKEACQMPGSVSHDLFPGKNGLH